MKIRDGFVTNSSSTSFIILTKQELTAQYLAKKLGLKKNSLNYSQIIKTCDEIVYCGKDGFYHHTYGETNFELVKELFGNKTAEVYKELINKGYELYCGKLSSEENYLESVLCVDSFIIATKDFFMDASACVW